MLRRAFPSVKDTCGTGYISCCTLDVVLESGFPSSYWINRTLRTGHSAARCFAGFSQHELKVATSLFYGRSRAHPQRAASNLSCRIWMERWAHFLGLLTTENDERLKRGEVGNRCLEDMERVNDGNDRLSMGGGPTTGISNSQFQLYKCAQIDGFSTRTKRSALYRQDGNLSICKSYSTKDDDRASEKPADPEFHDESQRAVVMALCCNFLVLSLKCGVWIMTASHVMLAEAVHSLADLANQALLAYGLVSSRRAPDDLHPYGYSKERFVWSLISAVGIFCLGSGATIVHGISNLWSAELPENMYIAALVLIGSMIMEGASLLVALSAVRKGASAEGMTLRDYVWRGHDPTAVAVMMEDGAAVTGLVIAGVSLVAVSITGNPIYDPIGSIFVGNLLGMVAVFLIQRNRHALLGRAMDHQDMKRVLDFLSSDPVVDAVYDCKSEVIGPRSYRFKAEIDFNGVVIVQNYLQRIGREAWINEFRQATNDPDSHALDRVMSNYGEEVVLALGSEVDRLEKEIQRLVPGIRHVDIETHNPNGPSPF